MMPYLCVICRKIHKDTGRMHFRIGSPPVTSRPGNPTITGSLVNISRLLSDLAVSISFQASSSNDAHSAFPNEAGAADT